VYWIGTSGYNYPEWRGSFYPAGLPSARMLPYYAARFPTVEINYTFYRLPTEKVLAGWSAATPDGFRLTLKAPRRITHEARLRDCQEPVDLFCRLALSLGPRLGVVLFQLPPNLKKDLGRLEAFVSWLPPNLRAAFEFRHDSWHDDEVFALLRAKNAALCLADSERLSAPLVATASYGYLRRRDEGYEAADLQAWAQHIAGLSADWSDCFVYFKHEEKGVGPQLAATLMADLEALASNERTIRVARP